VGRLPVVSSLQLISRRSLAHMRLLVAVVVGVVLAVAIMSASVVYFDSLRDLGLTRDLEMQDPADLDILIESSVPQVTLSSYRNEYDTVRSRIDSRFSSFAAEVHFGVRSNTFYYGGITGGETGEGAAVPPPNSDLRRLLFASMPGIEERSSLVAGALPEPRRSALDPRFPIEVAITEEAAASFGLEVGTVITAVPYWGDRHDHLDARVAGIIRPDPDEAEFWRLHDDGFGVKGSSFSFASLFIDEVTFQGPLGGYLPKMGASFYWLVDTDIDSIHASEVPTVRAQVLFNDTELRSLVDDYRQTTTLPEVLDRFGTRLFFNRLPMFVVVILIVAVLVYYVLAIGGLLVDAQRGEIALLRSRGATSRQIVLVYAVESFMLAALALAVGPFLALGAVSIMGVIPTFSALNDGALLPVRFTWPVFRMGAIGAALGLAALLVPSLRAARVGLLAFRQGAARPPRLPVFQRYYLDLGVLGVVMFFFWQLSRQGSFVAVRLLGDVVVDQLVLAVPAMFLVSAGIVLLRIFPAAMDWLGRLLSSRWLSRVASPTLVLGLWQMARNPAHHARLSLLLILTAGLGVFAASFGATLQRSFSDRVHYETGAEYRVQHFSPVRRGQSVNPVGEFERTGVAEVVSPAFRSNGSVVSQESGGFVQVLGIDPDSFADVAWSREDFTEGSFGDAVARVDSFESRGIPLPDDAEYISARVRPAARRADASLVARVSDSDGRFFTYTLGTLAPSSSSGTQFPCDAGDPEAPPPWCRIGAWLLSSPSFGSTAPNPPLRLEAIGVTPADPRRARTIRGGAFEIDDVSVSLSGGGGDLVIEDFGDLSTWGVLVKVEEAVADSFEVATDQNGNAQPGVARFAWSSSSVGELRGPVPGGRPRPMPALVSPSLIEAGNYETGDLVDVSVGQDTFTVTIASVVSYFPTLDPHLAPFVVVDGRSLARSTSVGRTTDGLVPNEVWLKTVDGVDLAGLRAALSNMTMQAGKVISLEQELEVVAVDPLVSAGWRALLAIAFFTVLLVSAIGFIVHAHVTFRARQTELALLRATGLSMRQLFALVTLEQLLVIGAGIAIGAFMGAQLGATIMPYLGTSGEGLQVVPPMILEIDWGSVAITFGLVAAVFAVVLAVILYSVYRMSVHRVLRLGER
jgi:ABC-type lipoprotein release transport system permease subunit